MMLTERGTVEILGRSDATINRSGVRLGSADIYEALFGMPGLEDALAVGVEEPDGGYWFPLFVVATGDVTADELTRDVRERIRAHMSPRHVPDDVIVVSRLPHTKTGKRLEVPVKRILQGEDPDVVVSRGAVDDPESLDAFATIARLRGGST
jgi:acetoacetyl-CoA synthetase